MAFLSLLFGAFATGTRTEETWAEDAKLVKRLKTGNRMAFAKLVEKYQHVIYTICYRMLKNREDAEDAAREAFVRSFEKIATLRNARKYYGWLKQIAINECHAILTERKKEDGDKPEAESSAETPEKLLEQHDIINAVRNALAGLDEADQEIVELKHFCELKFDEVARRLGIPVNTAKTRFYRALEKLAGKLEYLKE